MFDEEFRTSFLSSKGSGVGITGTKPGGSGAPLGLPMLCCDMAQRSTLAPKAASHATSNLLRCSAIGNVPSLLFSPISLSQSQDICRCETLLQI